MTGRELDVPARSAAAGDRALVRDADEPPPGLGSDVAGSRPYRPGDDIDTIDWAASARLSTARGSRRVRRARALRGGGAAGSSSSATGDRSMSLFARRLPWLDKPRAMRSVVELILASAGAAGRASSATSTTRTASAYWRQPKGERKLIELRDQRLWSSEFDGPPTGSSGRSTSRVASARRDARHVRLRPLRLPPAPPRDEWLDALEHRWDIVPVIIQDPIWEQSFPDVSGIVVPLRDPRTGRNGERTARSAVRWRPGVRATSERTEELDETFRSLDHRSRDPSPRAERSDILAVFLEWTDLRRTRRVIGA